MASQFGDDAAQLHLAIGVELLAANNQPLAETLVKQVQASLKPKSFKPAPKPVPGTKRDRNAKPEPSAQPEAEAPKAPPPPALLLALLVALRKDAEAAALAPPPQGDAQSDTPILAGYVEGWARRGEAPKARQRARSARFAIDRFQALLAVAEVELETKQRKEAAADLDVCLGLATGELKDKISSPWLLFRLVRLAARAGLGEKALPVASLIRESGLRSRAQLEIMKQRLAETNGSPEEALAQLVDKETLSHGLALEALARHSAGSIGYSFARAQVAGWDPPKERPFGDIGIALGLEQSSAK